MVGVQRSGEWQITANAVVEAGYTQVGAGAASLFGSFFNLRRSDRRLIVGCGAAGAIAAAFGARCVVEIVPCGAKGEAKEVRDALDKIDGARTFVEIDIRRQYARLHVGCRLARRRQQLPFSSTLETRTLNTIRLERWRRLLLHWTHDA
jgi:hypothetical protein